MEVMHELTPRDIVQYWKHLYGHSGLFATQCWLGLLVVVGVGLLIASKRRATTSFCRLAVEWLMSSLSGRSHGLNSFSSFERRSRCFGSVEEAKQRTWVAEGVKNPRTPWLVI